MEPLSVLNRKRGSIKGQISRITRSVNDELSKIELNSYLDNVKSASNKLEQLTDEYFLLQITEEQLEDAMNIISDVEEEIHRVEVRIKTLILKNENDDNKMNNTKVNTAQNVCLKLPQIPLPVFHGKFEEWNNFLSQFKFIIDQDSNLSDTEKLFYLKGCLKGDAKELETADDTYDSLLEALKLRYDNKRIIIDCHIKNLLNLPSRTETFKDLRHFLDTINKNLRSLKVLKYEIDTLSNALLLNVIMDKLDRETRKQFENELKSNEVPDVNELLTFLERKCQIFCTINATIPPQSQRQRTLISKSHKTPPVCIMCKTQVHPLYQCQKFKELKLEDRVNVIKKHKLCYNCLSAFHSASSCNSKSSCFVCKQSGHHTLLHRYSVPLSHSAKVAPSHNASEPYQMPHPVPDSPRISLIASGQSKTVLINTAVVYVRDSLNKRRALRAVLDSASECSFLTSRAAEALGLMKERVNIPICGLSDSSVSVKFKSTSLISNEKEDSIWEVDFLLVPKITDVTPSKKLNISSLDIPKNVQLADPNFHIPQKIDILLGAELFFKLLKEDKIQLKENLILQDSCFGYLVSGSYSNESNGSFRQCFLSKTSLGSLDKTLKSFWEMESVGMEMPRNEEDMLCEEHVVQTQKRNVEGRYIVSMPLTKEPECLGNSKEIAFKRLKSLWKRPAWCPAISQRSTATTKTAAAAGTGWWRGLRPSSAPAADGSIRGRPLTALPATTPAPATADDALAAATSAPATADAAPTGHAAATESTAAYGAVVYLQCIDANETSKCSLLASKSRVAPIQVISVPRLELSACLLLAQLIQKVIASLRQPVDAVQLWSDSTVALAWIETSPHLLKTFVSVRVSQIQELTSNFRWMHIPSKDNPADLISRGLDAKTLAASELWWKGSEMKDIPTSPEDVPQESKNSYLNELKTPSKITLTVNSNHNFFDNLIHLTNNFQKLIRILAFIFRFIDNCHNSEKQKGSLTASELANSLLCLVKNVQAIYFAKEIECIKKGKQLPNSSNILNLSPYLDDKNILRVGGRLRHSNLPEQQKHPMLIPNNSSICELIINHYHVLYLHTGTEATLANIRTQFWITNGRSIVKKVIKKCVTCLRVSAKGLQYQMMADLPGSRVCAARVFSKVGLDFCGPFNIKVMPGRGKKVYKCYICIFVCFVVRAIHLEVVNNLSTEAFIGALKRFIARRGRPNDVYSDNGTNFIGANNEFKKVLKELFARESSTKIEDFLAREGVNWYFNPPATPHFGGLWEAGVKSLKSHFKRVVGDAILTHEEFFTLTTQVEAVLNSRPLCPLSEDPNDELALTPAHFLVGSTLTSLPELNFQETPRNKLSRWELVQKLSQTFWSKWSKDYLNRLQARPKWFKGNREFRENDVVLLKGEDNSKSLRWNLAKIIKVHPGVDNIIRVVTLKTSKGIYKRPVHKIVKLPFDSN